MNLLQDIQNYFRGTESKINRIDTINSQLKEISLKRDVLVSNYNTIAKGGFEYDLGFDIFDFQKSLGEMRRKEKSLQRELGVLNNDKDVVGALSRLKATGAKNIVKSLYKEGKITLEDYNKTPLSVKTEKGQVKYADVVVVTEENEILLLMRSLFDSSNPGAWVVPGGHVDEGETDEQAAKRELLEESGISVDNLAEDISKRTRFYQLGSFEDDKVHISYYCLIIQKKEDVELLLQAEETRDYLWVPNTDLINYEMVFNMRDNILKMMGWELTPQQKIIRKAFEQGIIDEDVFNKAMGHKYIRKEPDGKGGWDYIYEEKKNKGVMDHDEKNPILKKGEEIKGILEKLGVNFENLTTSFSHTDYGNSYYITYWDQKNQPVKFRISDHDVENFKRATEESHFRVNDSSLAIAKKIEILTNPERYDKVVSSVKYYTKEEAPNPPTDPYGKYFRKRYVYPNQVVDGEVKRIIESEQQDDYKFNFGEDVRHEVIEKEFSRISKKSKKPLYKYKIATYEKVTEEPTYSYIRKEPIDYPDEELIQKAINLGLLSDDDIEKAWKKHPVGTVVTRKDGKKYRKISETNNSKQDWVEVKDGKAPKTEDVKKDKQGKQDIGEAAKEVSETALQNAIKRSPDEEVRRAAHEELKRREKEERPDEETEGKKGKVKPIEEENKYVEKFRTLPDDQIKFYLDAPYPEVKEAAKFIADERGLKLISKEDYIKQFENYSDKSNKELKEFYSKEASKSLDYLYNKENFDEKISVNMYIKAGGYIMLRFYYEDEENFEERKIKAREEKKYLPSESRVGINKISNDLSKFISNNKIERNLSLNRRINADNTFFKELKEGDIYTDKSFSSTSLKELKQFGDFNIKILAKKGSNVANIQNNNELEYLIDKGSKFRVIEKHKNGKGITVELL